MLAKMKSLSWRHVLLTGATLAASLLASGAKWRP